MEKPWFALTWVILFGIFFGWAKAAGAFTAPISEPAAIFARLVTLSLAILLFVRAWFDRRQVVCICGCIFATLCIVLVISTTVAELIKPEPLATPAVVERQIEQPVK